MQFKPMAVKQQGFTIIELVVVILLLGILAATALPRFIDVTTQAHQSAFEGTAGGLSTGVALYRAEFTARGQRAANVPLASFGGLRSAPGYSAGTYVAAVAGPTASTFTSPTDFTGTATGYPLATNANINKTTNPMTSEHCVQVFQNILQGGSASIGRLVNSSNAAITGRESLALGTPASPTALNDANVTTEANTLQTLLTTSVGQARPDFTAVAVEILSDTGFTDDSAPNTARNAAGLPRNHVDLVPACVYSYTAEAENYARSVLYVPWTGRLEVYNTLNDLIRAAQYSGPRV